MKPRTILAQRPQRDERSNDEQRGAPRTCAEESVIAAFKEGFAVAAIARSAGRTPRSIQSRRYRRPTYCQSTVRRPFITQEGLVWEECCSKMRP